MGMMERFLENHSSCDCPDCRKSTSRLRKITSQVKDTGKENMPTLTPKSPTDSDRHLCSEHRSVPLPPRKAPSRDKDKDKLSAVGSAAHTNRADKINKLLKAESIPAVLDVFKTTPTTADENKLATDLQEATSQCKTFVDSKAKIISFCHDDTVDLDAVFGLLAKFRQERSILTSAMIKSNNEREKYLQSLHEVDDLMGMLRDVIKDGKGPSGDELRHNLGSMIFKIHDIARNPSSLWEELQDLRDEHLDLLADHEEQNHKFLDIESCHEKLHEDKKQLQDDLAWEKRDHLETRKKLSAIQGTKAQVTQTADKLEKSQKDNSDLRKEVERLTAELAKINSLKHENTQLKKKLSTVEASKPEPCVEEKPLEIAPVGKKKKGKKGTAAVIPAENEEQRPGLAPESKANSVREKEVKLLQQTNAEIQSQLDNAQTNLRQLEALLKKAEVAKTKALERQQIEQATAQNWKEMSEGHLEESNRLREQLDESITNATNLQNDVHRLEQSLAELKDQLKSQMQKRSSSPSITSQTSMTSKIDTDSVRMLRKLHGETTQLVHDLDTAKSYPGDPWNLVECTRNMIAAIDQDLEGILVSQKESDTPNPIPETYLPYPRNDLGLQSPMPRTRDPTPPLSVTRARNTPSSYHRPLLPPGLADPNLGRASPTVAHMPSPIGTGRPSKSPHNATPSPVPVATKVVTFTEPPPVTVGNGSVGVDWSIWANKR